jgi:hypothetical protein
MHNARALTFASDMIAYYIIMREDGVSWKPLDRTLTMATPSAFALPHLCFGLAQYPPGTPMLVGAQRVSYERKRT